MKKFPKTIYVTRTDPERDANVDYFVQEDTKFIEDEEVDTEVAVYQLVKVGSVARKSRIVFE